MKLSSLSRIVTLGVFVVALAGVGSTAFAQTPIGTGNTGTTPSPIGTGNTNPPSGDGGGTQLLNPLSHVTSLPQLLDLVLQALIKIGEVVLVLAVIWVGFLFVRAQGKPAEIEKAKQVLIWTLIGGAIVLGAQQIAHLVESTVQSL